MADGPRARIGRWQSVYSEYHFCDAYRPAFREIDFLHAIRTYQQRARHFGR